MGGSTGLVVGRPPRLSPGRAPRGHAKSAIVSLVYILWCLLYGKEEFVLLVSATTEQADQLLDHVKRQLETNAKLRADFPQLGKVRTITPPARPDKNGQVNKTF